MTPAPAGVIPVFIFSLPSQQPVLQLGGLHGDIVASTSDGFNYKFNSSCPLWAFWSNEEEGDYVCIEPWWGINDFPAAPRELALKPFMNFDDGAGQAFSYMLTITKD